MLFGFYFLFDLVYLNNFNLVEQLAYMSVMILMAMEIKRDDRIRQRNLELMREVENFAANSSVLAKQEERNRISRDLHDRLGHQLVAINIQLQKAVAYREINAAESDQAVLAAQQANTEAIRELRQTLGNLREIDTPTDFRTDLDKLIEGVRQNGLPVNYIIRGSEEDFSNLVLLTIRQAVQEGLTNAEKHARASHVDLTLVFDRRRVSLTLQDDGAGFSPDHLQKDGSFGLSGLRERVDLTRGKFRIDSKPGRGTTLKITIPRKLVQ
jgi:signal transduction histidine kinase